MIFTFDDRAYEQLQEVVKAGKYVSMANAVRDGLQLLAAVQQQAGLGYNEIVFRNKSGKERTMVRS